MRARIEWFTPVYDAFMELAPQEREEILEKLELLKIFPRMYEVRTKGRYRRHRYFYSGNWLVYYRVVENTVYIRGLWPARMKP